MSGYPITLTPDDNGTWLITCEALPEVTTFCDHPETFAGPAALAIEEALAARIAGARDVPAPMDAGSPLASLSLLATLKIDLYRAMRASGVTKAQLGRRLSVHGPQVDRLLRLDHASRLDQIEAAFAALDYHLHLTMEPA